jgi:pimeloyl-ACP methyl ester carboxylesterase
MTTASSLQVPLTPLAARDWLDQELYPFESHFYAHADGRMHYVDEGAGPPILFVHGTPSWSFEWRHAIQALHSQHRCIAIDHLGFGLSDKPEAAAYCPADHTRRLWEFVEALDLREFVLVVHDFGGPIALPLALAEPPRVRALVIVNTWMWSHGDQPRVARASRLVASPLGRFLYCWLNASPRWLLPSSFADRKHLTPAIHRHYLAPFATRRARTAPWMLGCALVGSDAYYAELWQKRQALTSIPTTLIWGTRDPAFGTEYLARWKNLLPNARTVELPAGHFPQEERPDAVTEAIRARAGRET